jgi:hypothetical protein
MKHKDKKHYSSPACPSALEHLIEFNNIYWSPQENQLENFITKLALDMKVHMWPFHA